MPQFETLVAVSTQRPLHVAWPDGQPHAPMLHACPPVHALPQKPQLSGSLVVFVQLVPHAIKPALHDAEHVPAEQYGLSAPQTVPHAPQFMASDIVFTHAEPHADSGAIHAHAPCVHVCMLPHIVPHAPQFFGSVFVSVQIISRKPAIFRQLESPVPHASELRPAEPPLDFPACPEEPPTL